MTSEKGKLKKLYIKALMEQGDPRSYNEIQADMELMLWEQRFKGIHEVGSALEATSEELPGAPVPTVMGAPIEEPNVEA